MKNSKWTIILLWMIAQLAVYELTVFGLLKSFQSGGFGYYIALCVVYLILFSYYYYSLTSNVIIKVRSLIKPMILSILLLGILLIILSFVFPETFKESELAIYRGRLETNGYSSTEVEKNMALLEKFYLVFIFIGCSITHLIIGSISILIFKLITKIKKKTILFEGNSIH